MFKRAIRANSDPTSYITFTSASKFDTESEVNLSFVQRCCNVSYFTTERTPSELLCKQTIRTKLDLIRLQVQRQVTGSKLCSICNHDRTVRDRVFNEGKDVFVWQYLDPRNGAGRQILRHSGPLFHEVKVKDQVYFRHAS